MEKQKRPRAGQYEVAVRGPQKDGSWLVSWPNLEAGARRRRCAFPDSEAANAFANRKRAEFVNHGRAVAGLRASSASQAAEAAALLAPYGVTILEACRAYVARAKARTRSMLVPDAVDTFLAARKPTASVRYYGDLQARLRRLAKKFPDDHVSDLTHREVGAWLADSSSSALDRGNNRRVLSVFWSWAQLEGFAESNIIATIPAPKEPAPPCETFTPDEIKLMLDNAPPELVPFLATQAFAGVRASEVARLDWKHIDFKRDLIRLDAGSTKTGARRFVPIPQNLKLWLAPYASTEGKLVPANLNTRLVRFHHKLKEDHKVKHRHNGLRHSFASYALAKYEDAPKVALWCGHDVKTLLKHYRDLVGAEDAEAWFSIVPPAINEENKEVPQ
jgi:integrase